MASKKKVVKKVSEKKVVTKKSKKESVKGLEIMKPVVFEE